MDSLGPENDDLGLTTLDYYQKRFPDVKPNSVVELGCTVGHSLLPWARAFPDAEVHGIDVGAPCVRYAHARAEALGVKAHFSQQNAEGMDFESDSVDVIISHFFMHETSKSALKRIFRECLRILKPGGAMLHLDVEQERGLDPLTSFLMDWEVHNNNEQFMGALRDMDIEALAIEAGFDGSKVELVTQPSHMGREQVVGDGYINFFTWPIHVGIK
jgi:ubiquinone/menaquinone biosynthesis C-methylase UbiE